MRYGPISDNAGDLMEMAELKPEVRERTDKLDVVNTTANIGKIRYWFTCVNYFSIVCFI